MNAAYNLQRAVIAVGIHIVEYISVRTQKRVIHRPSVYAYICGSKALFARGFQPRKHFACQPFGVPPKMSATLFGAVCKAVNFFKFYSSVFQPADYVAAA